MAMDFSKMQISPSWDAQNYETQKIITTVPLRKPKKLEFFRVRPDDEENKWTYDTFMVAADDGGEDEKYLVAPEYWPEFQQNGLLKPVRFYALITHSTNVFFLSEVALPDAEGKWNSYNRSRAEHYERAKTEWVRIAANMALGAYDLTVPVANFAEPVWPEQPATIQEALELAFKDKYIDSDDHPLLNRLRGLA